VRKTYQALVFGKPRQDAEMWKDVLDVRKQGGRIRTAAGAGNLPAVCAMKLLRAGSVPMRTSLIRLEPQTGRSHQLRVQCAKRGLPIVGDKTYGEFRGEPAVREGRGGKADVPALAGDLLRLHAGGQGLRLLRGRAASTGV
jgi:tRNA pseudouridine65 synthase